MRIHTEDKRLIDYTVGETVMVDVSYQSQLPGRSRPAQLVEGIVKVDTAQPLSVMVGSGAKVHDAKGMMVSIDDAGMNWNGDHWFGIRTKCQEYRGKGTNWFRVSAATVIENGTVSCSKCQK